MKKSLIPIISILTLGLASAQLSFSDVLSNIDSSLIILSSVFIIAFLIFNFSLSKIFKEQKNIAMTISAVLSFLVVYGINSFGWDIENFFFDIGISEDLFLTIIPLIVVAGIIFLFVKAKKKRNVFYLLGGFLAALGLLIFKEAAEVLVMGVVLIVFGMIIVPLLNFLKKSLGFEKNSPPKTNVTSTH